MKPGGRHVARLMIAQGIADRMAVCKCVTLGVTTEIEILGAIRFGIHDKIRGGEILLAVRGDKMIAPIHN